jgi:hypothetical protein
MTIEATVAAVEVKGNLSSNQFSSLSWLEYFQQNRANKTAIDFPENIVLPSELNVPLLHSLQRFQIGETGEGKHLRSYAKYMKNEAYEECIDLFIKEEQSHARILAEMIGAMDGTLLTSHWTDLAFIALRRMMGLKTELFILLIAEVIGKCFYLLCSREIPHERMSNAFSIIVLDEIAHLRFHSLALNVQLNNEPRWFRVIILKLWTMLFGAACLVFVWDHAKTLAALQTGKEEFSKACVKEFNRAAAVALALEPLS